MLHLEPSPSAAAKWESGLLSDRMLAASCLFVALFASVATRARAQFGATAEVDPIPEDEARADETVAATELSLPERPPSESLTEVLREAPGARVLRSGLDGAFAGVALRGAELGHTTVLLGEIPISSADGGAFDFGLVPTATLERVEVFRGGGPAWLSQAPIGGVVRLVPRVAATDGVGARAYVGSFGSGGVHVDATAGGDHARSTFVVGARGTRGDFEWLDNRCTILDPTDDVQVSRRNADQTEGNGLWHVHGDVGRTSVDFVALGVSRVEGVSGSGCIPAQQVRRRRLRGTAGLSLSHRIAYRGRAIVLQALASGSFDRHGLTDRYDELGVSPGTLADDRRQEGFGRVASRVELASWLDLIAVVTARAERFEPHDALARQSTGVSHRSTLNATLETRWHARAGGVRFEARPSASWLASRADVAHLDGSARTSDEVSVPNARLGVAVEPSDSVAVVGSIATGSRLPTLTELFGDRGFLLPNGDLREERGRSGDFGGRVRAEGRGVRASADARAFFLRIDDLIRYTRTAQYQAIAENIARGRVRGVESASHLELFDRLTTDFALTFLHTEGDNGRPLPYRPTWNVWWRLEGRSRRVADAIDLAVRVEVIHVAANTSSPNAFGPIPGRTWVGGGVRIAALDGALAFDVAVDDFFDRRGEDLLGFPLPGRRVAVSVAYRKEM